MDGSSRKILLSQGLGWPTSIVLDQLSWKIFWSDDKFHCIGSANLDGTGIDVSVLFLVIGLCEMSCALCKTHPGNLTITVLDVAANTNQRAPSPWLCSRMKSSGLNEDKNSTTHEKDDWQEPGCPHQRLEQPYGLRSIVDAKIYSISLGNFVYELPRTNCRDFHL